MEATPSTFVDVLEAAAASRPGRPAFRFLVDGTAAGEVEEWSYAQLASRARAIATELTARGLAGKPVLLLYPTGLEFVAAFFGCLYAGAVAVPAYPPDPARLARTLPRLRGIASASGAAAVLTTSGIAGTSRALAAFAPDLARLDWLATDPLTDDRWHRPDLGGDTVAFLQYTSGSTSAPKGVAIAHTNLLHNERVIRAAFHHDGDSVALGWLPLFHDMGLIGHVLQPVFLGSTGYLMAPQDFLRRPVEWLRAMSRFRVDTTGGPDFAYALCARKVTDAEIAELDLSAWRVAYSGAELVRAPTLRRFAERFAPAGFRAEALLPCYGLAESTLMATCSPFGPGPRTVVADAAGLERGRLAPPSGRATELVGLGGAFEGAEVRIVDPETRAVRPDGAVGEIWLRGGSVAAGYHGDADATEATFRATTADGDGPFLRTGDLGLLHEGALFVTGRAKDVIVVRGRNLWPEDVEEAAEAAHPAVRAGCSAAFAVEAEGEERLVVACEIDDGADARAVAEAIRGAVVAGVEADVHAVALLGRRALPKTSSGKRQRRATRAAWLDGSLEEVARVVFAEATGPAAEPAPTTLPEMEAWLARQVAAVLGTPAKAVPRDVPFAELGLDSVRAVELATRLDARLDRPLHASVLYNVPTVARLATWLVEGGAAATTARGDAKALYPDLAAALERLDRRNPATYRFDLERDVPWDRVDAPGLYVPREMFAALGMDVAAVEAEPEAWRTLQAAAAMTMLTAFEVVEVTITLFIDTRWPLFGETRSIAAFREEETKHVRLFRRYNDALQARHPELVTDLDWDRSWGVGFWELFRRPELFPDERVFHYLFWFFFVAFEEHSIYFADVLAKAEGVQPAWLAAHLAHRREELQHVATDHAYATALDLPAAERDAWSEVCVAWLCQHFETFFAFGSARRLVAKRFPHLAGTLRTGGFVGSPFLGDLATAPSFKRTRLVCPYLRELGTLDPAARPTDADLARRLPAAWLDGRDAVVPDPVESK